MEHAPGGRWGQVLALAGFLLFAPPMFLFGPLAARMELLGVSEMGFFRTIATIIMGFANELPPKVAIDQARRGVRSEMRPTREELEEIFKEVDAT